MCVFVCVCLPLSQTDYTLVPLYLPSISLHPVVYSNSPTSSESGSKSELHLFASRNSISAPALQSQGNILALILPDSPKGDTLGLQILYEVKQLQESPPLQPPRLLWGPLFVSETCHHVGIHIAPLSGLWV